MTAAHTPKSTDDDERATVEPFAEQLLEFVRRTNPAATYTLVPPIDPGIWIMHLYVSGEFVDDLVFSEELAERRTDILIKHDVAIAMLFRDQHAALTTPATQAVVALAT
jgi:hypothetical protein